MKSVTIEAKTFAEMLGITEGELIFAIKKTGTFKNKTIPQPHEPHKSNNRFGTVAKLAMRQPFVLFKGLTFQKLCLP
ncbi:hypothetical protein, partial [Klebsiella pneumoniae]|uniref:hypothetical protein n=1 Tax=Klebsiella pneumoniae TaxID=573 RepID=UPI0028F8D9B2